MPPGTMGIVDRRVLWQTRIKSWLPVCAWAGLIFYLSTDSFSSNNTEPMMGFFSWLWPGVSTEAMALVHKAIRKVGHWSEYFVLAVLMLRALRLETGKKWEWRHAVLTFVFILVYALTDEWHQTFVPSRTASFGDVFIDLLGGICGIFWTYGYSRGILTRLISRTSEN